MSNPWKILLVEDEPDLASLFGDALVRTGFTVERATNGADGLAKIKKFKPDLVLLDLVIPQIDGYQVLAELKKQKPPEKAKIYAWSNLTQKNEIDKAKKLGVCEYLIKSDYTPTKLVEKVRSILGVS